MADRKAGDAGPAPIPKAKKEDVEDVSWALSTAEAMWSRGDRADALKWLRRAAEAASEAERDERALELAKAAADLAGIIEKSASIPPPPADGAAVARGAPSAPRVAAVAGLRSSGKAPLAPAVPSEPRKGRRSGTDLTPTTHPRRPSERPPRRASRDSGTNELRRRARASKPTDTEIEEPIVQAERAEPGPVTSRTPSADEIDAWPTQALPGNNLTELQEEMTRVSAPAYVEESSANETSVTTQTPLRPSQAMRVVLWRQGDTVRVAPWGTAVSAITLDAMLVALDATADLAAWLGKK
jgi:hypothetical protein